MGQELQTTKPGELLPGDPNYVNHIPSEELASKAIERIKATKISNELMHDYATYGRHSRSKGARDVGRGVAALSIAYLTQQRAETQRHLLYLTSKKRLTKEQVIQVEKINRSLADMADAIDKANKTLLATEGTLTNLPGEGDDPPPVVPSFGAGQTVGPTIIHAQTVNISEKPQPTAPPAPK